MNIYNFFNSISDYLTPIDNKFIINQLNFHNIGENVSLLPQEPLHYLLSMQTQINIKFTKYNTSVTFMVDEPLSGLDGQEFTFYANSLSRKNIEKIAYRINYDILVENTKDFYFENKKDIVITKSYVDNVLTPLNNDTNYLQMYI